jgi:glyoxylase-like metal-dependent hydrolase (beta-lactamase superfamily II)
MNTGLTLWESESVRKMYMEERMATALQLPEVAPGHGFVSEEAKRRAEQARTERARKRQALNLQRENILSQRTSHPARRAALEAALEQIEGQLEAMN